MRISEITLALTIGCVFCLTGCESFFGGKSTEIESRTVLRELEEIKPVPKEQGQIPDIYKEPPRIVENQVGDQKDARVFYFTKHHTAKELAVLVNKQFVERFLNSKKKPYPQLQYAVSANDATNQLIVRCPTVTDAQQVVEFLENVDVPPIQVRIDCLISEVYADMTMDWETTLKIQNLFGENISLGGKGDNPAFPGAALRDAARATFGLKTGYVKNEGVSGHEFRTLVDMLVSRGYLKILMNPSLQIVNGKSAEIMTSEHVPLDQISTVTRDGFLTTSTVYENVVDSLKITPHAFADGSVGLETSILLGSKSTPEGVKQIPIVTKRQVKNKDNRIRQGESLVIGGIRKTERRSVIRGVPFLKDIPLIGILFSSKDFEERGKEVLFIITPTISTGGIPNEQMVESIRNKQAPPKHKTTLTERVMDPFIDTAYTAEVELRAAEAKIAREQAEGKRAEAERKINKLKEELKKASEDVDTEKNRVEKSKAEAIEAKESEQKAKAELDELKKQKAEEKTPENTAEQPKAEPEPKPNENK